jgi:hypothetical protein
MRNALECFIAGVPPLGYFELEVSHLAALVKSSRKDKFSSLNPTAEVALIGLSAYFEAFCKAQFAALVNICPQILENFIEKRQNATVSLKHVLAMQVQGKGKLGSVISEDHDFGSAKEINGLYQDLLRITPFSTKEAKDYARLLCDRNLLVHHGGVFTLRYSSQRFVRQTAPGLAHWDSLVVGKKEFGRWKVFIVGMAKKIAVASRTALKEFVIRERIKLSAEQKKARAMLA